MGWSLNLARRFNLGKVITDYGVFAKEKFFGNQELRLLKCQKNGEEFFVLECRVTAFMTYDLRWYKVSEKNAKKLVKILSE